MPDEFHQLLPNNDDLLFTDKVVNIDNGWYLYLPHLFSKEKSDYYFDAIKEKVEWKQKNFSIYGKNIPFPRLMAWYGDPRDDYRFSGIALQPADWLEELREIKNEIETIVDTTFNSVLLNYYRYGTDSIAWHSDDEKELGNNPIIASVSFGETRKFQLKHKTTKERIDLLLTDGSLLIMGGELQHHWVHQIPKTKKPIGERINLTFRRLE